MVRNIVLYSSVVSIGLYKIIKIYDYHNKATKENTKSNIYKYGVSSTVECSTGLSSNLGVLQRRHIQLSVVTLSDCSQN